MAGLVLFWFVTIAYAGVFIFIGVIIYLNTNDKPMPKITKDKESITGEVGEQRIVEELNYLDKTQYLVLNDVLLENNNYYSQIDHIIVSDYGIFVIETKNITGYISGEQYDNKWEVKLGKYIYYMQNPMTQNYSHIKALQELLGLKKELFIPIVCISNNKEINTNCNNVVPIYKLIRLILSYNDCILNDKEKIYEYIKENNITDENIRQLHIDRIKESKKKYDPTICPKCGGELLKRKAKKRRYTFIGCSNYPRCRYTRKLNSVIVDDDIKYEINN